MYNQCDIDYYMRSVSKATSNVSGLFNQLVNTYFRSGETTEFTALAAAIKTKDVTIASKLLGKFTKDFLMTEIPDAAGAGAWVDVGSMM